MGRIRSEWLRIEVPGVDRRTVLRGLATLGLTPTLTACGDSAPQQAGPAPDVSAEVPVRFEHGVASGDPYADSVVLWTRVTPADEADIQVAWELATDEGMNDIVASGVFATNAARDYTVKVVAERLQPATHYWYRFRCGDAASPLGRTKTAPTADAALEQLKFAFASCAWYSMGYFNAYRGIAERADLDVVLMLGDYIYEYGGDELLSTPFALGRYMAPGHEIVTLADYRQRHALYKTDPDLQAAHAAHPWICTWDDHESTNNSYTEGAENHTEGEEGEWTERKRIATQAYFEWLPVRDEFNPNNGAGAVLYRRLQYGDLAEFFVLDTRLEGRSAQPEDNEAAADPARNMISQTQEQWLLEGMRNTSARWKIIAQQTMLSQLYVAPNRPFTLDSWDGYTVQRGRLLEAFSEIDDVVVITGDIHTAFCNELTPDPTSSRYQPGVSGSVGVEFVCPSITSQGLPPAVVNALQPLNRHIRYAQGSLETNHGYVVVTATPQWCDAAWIYALSVLTPIKAERPGLAWRVNSGETTLQLSGVSR